MLSGGCMIFLICMVKQKRKLVELHHYMSTCMIHMREMEYVQVNNSNDKFKKLCREGNDLWIPLGKVKHAYVLEIG